MWILSACGAGVSAFSVEFDEMGGWGSWL